MTSRMNLAYVAMAAVALMMSDVTAARALHFCDIYPNRCQYSASGKGYYYPLGYRMPSTAGTANSTAAWGCVATDGKIARGRSWGFPNRLSATYGALSACAKRGTSCRLISCNPSIHSNYESYAAFGNVHR
jgi:hypothetical protein